MTFIRKIKKRSGTYLAEVETYREHDKVKQRVIKYLGKDIDGKLIKKTECDKIKIKDVKRSLDVLAIDTVANELGIKNLKNKYFLALIYSHLLENRSIRKMENWMRFTEIPDVLGLQEVSTKDLYESLTDVEEEEFEKINSEMQDIFKKYDKTTNAAVIDVTDTYFEGNTQNIKRRKGKEDKVKKLVQIGLAVSFRKGFPLFHKQYHGNLSNIQIFKDMSLELKKQDVKSIFIDRGMMSYENLQASLNMNIKLIAGLKKDKKLVERFISKINREDIYKIKNKVQLKNTMVFIKNFHFMKGKLIAVYNPGLEVVKRTLNIDKGIDSKKDIGYSLIYSNTEYSPEEIVKKYYEKEIIERAFKQLKGILGLRPIRVWLKKHVNSHIRICYLAYAILSLMNFKLRRLKISSVDALDSLKYGYKVSLIDEKHNYNWSLTVPLEPNQKNILRALNVVYKN